jgi:hypothetical protein
LAVGCWLLAAGCWLLAAGCWLLAVACWLLAVGCWLLPAKHGRVALPAACDLSAMRSVILVSERTISRRLASGGCGL